MRWVIALAAIGTASTATAQPIAPVEVLVVGTFHFDNPGRDLHNPKADDVLKPARQREIEAVTRALAEYRPTKIMVERLAKTPDLVDPNFSGSIAAQLATNRDERVQLAYRLAQQVGHRTVYAIDEQPGEGEPDYFPFDKVAAWAEANAAGDQLKGLLAEGAKIAASIERSLAQGTIADALRELNRPERAEQDQSFYYRLLSFGDTDRQVGADLNAMWYLRNAKIFAKLQSVVRPGDRVLVVYGAGHNYWLRHFASTAPGFRSVDPTPYLERAAASRR